MLRLLLLSSILWLGDEPKSATPTADDLNEYSRQRASLGRDPDAHVTMAEWCAGHGMEAESHKHLGIALLLKPSHARARALLGLEPKEPTANELARESALAEYREKAAKKPPKTADDHWALAVWCGTKGLKAEEVTHLWSVVALDRKREAAWKRLGYKDHNGRWMTPEQIAAEKVEKEAQEAAEKRWKPLLEKWKAALASNDKDKVRTEHRLEAISGLLDLEDPRAVPLVVRLFARGTALEQAWAVQVLGRIETPLSTRVLALLTLAGKTADVRRAAAESLRTRDPRDFAQMLIALLREKIKYELRPVNGPGQPGVLFVDGQDARYRRSYAPPTLADVAGLLDSGYLPRGSAGAFGGGGKGVGVAPPPTGGLVDQNGNPGHWAYIPKPGSYWDPNVRDPSPIPFNFGDTSPIQVHTIAQMPTVISPTGAVNLPSNVGKALTGAVPGGGSAEQILSQMAEQNVQSQVLAERQRQLEYEWAVSETIRMAQAARMQQLNDVATIERSNAETGRLNDLVSTALVASTGQDFGVDREAWTKWWKERSGYAYRPPAPRIKPTFFDFMPLNVSSAPPILGRPIDPSCIVGRSSAHAMPAMRPITGIGHASPMGGGSLPITNIKPGIPVTPEKVFMLDAAIGSAGQTGLDILAPPISCFAGETPVATPGGPRPIASLRPGDVIIGGDGSAVVVDSVHRQWDAPTLRLRIGGETIEATATHPFRTVGRGWVTAGNLSAGDDVRTLDGFVRVESISPGDRQAVYNLRLESGSSFLVGRSSIEVHDGSPIVEEVAD